MNRKLFNLGNNIISIQQKIKSLRGGGDIHHLLLDLIEDLTDVVDTMRMESLQTPIDFVSRKQENIHNFIVKIPCTENNLAEIIEQLQHLQINYTIN